MTDRDALTGRSYPESPERTLRRVSLDCPASASVGSRYVARMVAVGFLYLGAKLDELVQIAYRHTGLDIDPTKRRDGWSADDGRVGHYE